MKVTTDGCLFGAWVAAEMKNLKTNKQNALDLGCGTGLLSLMVAQQNEVAIDALEIDENAAQQANENVAASPWRDRITTIQSDVLIWQSDQTYDCIFSNPPFYESDLRSEKKEKNIAHHDAGLTLTALLQQIDRRLNSDGVFFLLLPSKREAEFEQLLKTNHFHLYKKMFVKQSAKHQPFRLMIEGGKQPSTEITEIEIAIKNERDEYTPAFVTLLKDYYLYL